MQAFMNHPNITNMNSVSSTFTLQCNC